jgi:hypothetical protein
VAVHRAPEAEVGGGAAEVCGGGGGGLLDDGEGDGLGDPLADPLADALGDPDAWDVPEKEGDGAGVPELLVQATARAMLIAKVNGGVIIKKRGRFQNGCGSSGPAGGGPSGLPGGGSSVILDPLQT